ncbi:TetR/AcrR family transcriptional regulator [Criblamydia sequanensis]|uniref:Transcriptional regulator n=1 Tax=Candidatus Criblamydia sequanensis CRIB-18 TaxID=1437425 RepID=A0A090D2B8_9BACT|nr:TetR/AcrR family transcriptional regulator [Criblamydia sequanensis]CDR34203.1 Transcriptional regulator [Criblamydia sequanensis CRIB-18]
MSGVKRRSYKSNAREAQAAQTKARILNSAKNLFDSLGFEYVTIEKIAQGANVSIPTIYSLFQSKLGVLRALMDSALPKNQFEALVEESILEKSPKKRLSISAKIARQMYDAERLKMSIFRGVAVLAPELRELEKEREMRRYNRQEVTIKAMVKENSLIKELSADKARDILWALTGRDIYRMFVIEQGWTSDEYEEWLTQLLIVSLIKEK